MQASLYQSLANRTVPGNLSFREKITMAQMGLSGEAGEFTKHVKGYIFHDKKLMVADVVDELGDILWYAALTCSLMNMSMDYVMEQNIDKLKKRYPNGYNHADSAARVDVAATSVVADGEVLER